MVSTLSVMGHQIDPKWWTHRAIYFLFQPVLHNWYNKGLVCAILSVGWYIKDPLLLIRKSSPCCGISTLVI